MTKESRDEKRAQEGKFAKRVYDHWCQKVFPLFNQEEKYVGIGGRDMKFLVKLIAASQNQNPVEWDKRLRRFAQDEDPFLIKQGYALHLFKWNAYSDSAMEKRNAGKQPEPFYARQG